MLVVALDIEEDEAYDRQFYAYVSGGYDVSKLPKRKKQEYADQKDDKVDVLGVLQRSGIGLPAARGSLREYAKVRGLKKYYQLPDGTFTDESGNPIETPEGRVFVPAEQKGG